MRAARRGTKEMDLILGPFATEHLGGMDAGGLDLFEAILNESDHDLYLWVTGQVETPGRYSKLMADITTHAGLV
ncbi:MAG: succinate dehydrogenase assembly factor 2 [Rhodobacteraceae bacterium]|nr:succinate dehydrogenase assembly factor 2 [Paracoccaceae bacterium]